MVGCTRVPYPPRLVPEFPSFPKEGHGPADVWKRKEYDIR